MNCFHFSVSLRYTTTLLLLHCILLLLWIAFIFQYLWDTQQHQLQIRNCEQSCELLSFFSIFEIHNNQAIYYSFLKLVVNCFHFSVSLRYTTTEDLFDIIFNKLWIAFIFQYLWDTKQRWFLIKPSFECCELLSFFSIFEIHNNELRKGKKRRYVVNCFHFSVSLRYTTTSITKISWNL